MATCHEGYEVREDGFVQQPQAGRKRRTTMAMVGLSDGACAQSLMGWQ